ncbi:PEP-CTERM sorting domain-containing protein [bacterium]|nr:PEP-CTERM sorting domain-containing protein [bacterium]
MNQKLSHKNWATVIGLILAIGFGGDLNAQILIQDTFAGRGGGNLMDGGRETPTYSTLPGAAWERMNISDSAWGAGQSSGGISLGASVPSLLEIKASIGMSQLGSGTIGSAQGGRGLGLGFFSVAGGGGYSQARFTGLVLDSAGRLNFAHDPNEGGFFDSGSLLGTAVAYGGTFVAANYYDLSYQINTATGAISNISLEGSSADYSLLAAGVNKFTAANVKYAGIYTSSEGGMSGYTSFDNFTVTSVPEPSTVVCLVTGLACLYVVRKKRQ